MAVHVSARARAVRAVLALGLAAPLLTGCFEEPSPHEAVRDFLLGWQSGDYAAAARRADGDPATVRRALEDVRLQLDAASIRFSIKDIAHDGDDGRADFHAEVDLGENNPLWQYDGLLPLHLVGGEWKVRWSPSVIHPDLHAGQRLAVATVPVGRKPILDRDGNPLQDETPLQVAGVKPAKIKDPGRLCEELSRVTGFAQDRLLGRILSSPPQDFVALATFGRNKYQQIKDKLAAIPGLEIVTDNPPVAPKSPVQIVGRVTAITAEAEQQLGGPQRAGDTIGRDGLQRAYQDQLTGSTETRIVILDSKTWQQVKELKAWPGRQNTEVRTTIDSRMQSAGDDAVRGSRPAALVAVQASTGEILAVSTSELNQETDALAGRFAPGTAFSIIAAHGLLKGGLDPEQKVPCSADRTVGGARFHQPGILGLVAPSFQTDFAQGCVTALASLARRINGPALASSAAEFGIGTGWRLPLRSFSGSVPGAGDDAAVAKVIAGQSARVSPLSMALVAAAVDSGTWRPPVLVLSPEQPVTTSEPSARPAPGPVALDATVTGRLRTLMRAGVSSGSAHAATAPGGTVYGVASQVTQTDKKQRRTLSWFVGWQGDVAVAVMAESGDPGTAATMAGSFFRDSNLQP
ncbi:penicillin-binding transpeptidase domain-containing protein [Microbispora sp. ATCC PTA-5024]|uniref:penicillin-binding transpeptidase domain-containing protein n=1 Tax=Microbispora sp. ATCC PTA-5024 TaxID=316330 RepID=UPI0003DB9CD3|nr:penicillin-binding transpeptidase domain-containing protein [Microbispora sp. ATCC PTA-5024]ETK33633.1 penicillin-binding protein [Microbispora sp. ATCC PTA-5024]